MQERAATQPALEEEVYQSRYDAVVLSFAAPLEDDAKGGQAE